jgi:hypothetical protein
MSWTLSAQNRFKTRQNRAKYARILVLPEQSRTFEENNYLMSEEAVQAAEAAEEKVEAQAEGPVAEPEKPVVEEAPVNPEDVSYQAVEKEGTVTAIWEMQGQKHLRTIDPRSNEGKQILALFETAA